MFFAAFGVSLLLYNHLGFSYFPQTDAGQFVINFKAPSGLPAALSRPWVPAALAATMMAIGILLWGIAVPDEAYRASDFVDLLADRSLADFDL